MKTGSLIFGLYNSKETNTSTLPNEYWAVRTNITTQHILRFLDCQDTIYACGQYMIFFDGSQLTSSLQRPELQSQTARMHFVVQVGSWKVSAPPFPRRTDPSRADSLTKACGQLIWIQDEFLPLSSPLIASRFFIWIRALAHTYAHICPFGPISFSVLWSTTSILCSSGSSGAICKCVLEMTAT